MTPLAELEIGIVNRLQEALLGGERVFTVVRGVSGGYRPALRDALRRERPPAAYVAFTEEPTAPETSAATRGARLVVLVAARALRPNTDPRHDSGTPGAFALIATVRRELDDYDIMEGLRLVNLHVKFVEADERFAVYELLYRAWPVVEPPAV